jgi:dethiobiotin synthetase
VPRPDRLVLVTGTGTEVGKTWVTAHAAAGLRADGVRVAARKPAQSFEPGEGPTDAEVLAAATGEGVEDVCPRHRWYEVAMAPPMAAARLGRTPVKLAELAAELSFPAGVQVGFVEGAGGVRSPLADDGDVVALAAALDPDTVVLVADAGLGTINAVLLSLAALRRPAIVVLNRFDARDGLHGDNLSWLREREGVDVVVGPDELVARLR